MVHVEYTTWVTSWYPRSLSLKFYKDLSCFVRDRGIFYIVETDLRGGWDVYCSLSLFGKASYLHKYGRNYLRNYIQLIPHLNISKIYSRWHPSKPHSIKLMASLSTLICAYILWHKWPPGQHVKAWVLQNSLNQLLGPPGPNWKMELYAYKH